MKLTAANANISNTLSTASISLSNTNIVNSLSIGTVFVTPAEIDVGNVVITPTAVSTPTLVLGGFQYGGGLQGGIINYQEFTANGTWYNPYANASVNASLSGYEQVLVMAWSGGGGGSSNNSVALGGGGGACVIGSYNLSSLTGTVSVNVGSGGTSSRTTTTGTSLAGGGGDTSFGSLISYGGGGGGESFGSGQRAGGGGGGWLSAGPGAEGGDPLGGAVAVPGGISTFGGGGGAGYTSGNGGASIFGGGGGGYTNGNGGISIYGGGGGSGIGTGVLGGSSIFGGNGGANGTSGSIPGGGGGANTSAANTGARGEVRVWVFGPAGTTIGAPTYTLTANTTTLYEGRSVLYTVSTISVANGTTLYYTLNNSSTAVATDFTSNVNGSVIINDGTGTFTLTANNDTDIDIEAFQIDVRTESTTGSIVASNGSVSIVRSPVTLIYRNTSMVSDNIGGATYTTGNMPIGEASPTRRVFAFITGNSNGNGRTIDSVTIGGVAATIHVQRSASSGGTTLAAIASAVVPTGILAAVVVNYSGSMSHVSVEVTSVDNLISDTPIYASGDAAGAASSLTLNDVNWNENGVVFGVACFGINRSIDWTGSLIEYEDTSIFGGNRRVALADLFPTSNASNQTLTVSTTSGSRFAFVVASFR